MLRPGQVWFSTAPLASSTRSLYPAKAEAESKAKATESGPLEPQEPQEETKASTGDSGLVPVDEPTASGRTRGSAASGLEGIAPTRLSFDEARDLAAKNRAIAPCAVPIIAQLLVSSSCRATTAAEATKVVVEAGWGVPVRTKTSAGTGTGTGTQAYRLPTRRDHYRAPSTKDPRCGAAFRASRPVVSLLDLPTRFHNETEAGAAFRALLTAEQFAILSLVALMAVNEDRTGSTVVFSRGLTGDPVRHRLPCEWENCHPGPT